MGNSDSNDTRCPSVRLSVSDMTRDFGLKLTEDGLGLSLVSSGPWQDCQNEEADRSTPPPISSSPFPSLPSPYLEAGPLNPARGSGGPL